MLSVRAALVALLLSIAAGAAAQSGWTRIGRAEIAAAGGSATIEGRAVSGLRDEFMICVEGHAIRIVSGELRYRDDRTQALRLGTLIRAGDCSRFFRLSGSNREIASFTFAYDPASLSGNQAIVEIYAR